MIRVTLEMTQSQESLNYTQLKPIGAVADLILLLVVVIVPLFSHSDSELAF